MASNASPTVRIRIDSRDALASFEAVRSEFQRQADLTREIVQALRERPELAIEIRAVERKRASARWTPNVRLTAKPTQRMGALLAALRALNRDLSRINRGLHGGASGASVGGNKGPHRRAGGRRRPSGGRR